MKLPRVVLFVPVMFRPRSMLCLPTQVGDEEEDNRESLMTVHDDSYDLDIKYSSPSN